MWPSHPDISVALCLKFQGCKYQTHAFLEYHHVCRYLPTFEAPAGLFYGVSGDIGLITPPLHPHARETFPTLSCWPCFSRPNIKTAPITGLLIRLRPPPEFSNKATERFSYRSEMSERLSNELLLNLGNKLNASPRTGCNYLLLTDALSHI